MFSVKRTGLAPSVGAVAAHEVRLAKTSRMPPALVASVIVNDPTAVVAAPAPSLRFSVAVAPDTATDARVSVDGAEVSVHPVLPAVHVASRSENGIASWSTLPLPSRSLITMVRRTGLALSRGALVANQLRLPAESWMSPEVGANARVKALTLVSGAPAPSVMVSVAVVVATDTDARVPPDGMPVRVHGPTVGV